MCERVLLLCFRGDHCTLAMTDECQHTKRHIHRDEKRHQEEWDVAGQQGEALLRSDRRDIRSNCMCTGGWSGKDDGDAG